MRKKVGIIGLGKITQLKHLYNLFNSQNFKIEAICDISEKLVDEVGELYNVPYRFNNYQEMYELPLDIIMVLTHDHAQPIIDSLKAGFDVFTEKPLCWTESEALEIEHAKKESGKQVIIGYMKRYMPNYIDLKKQIQEMKDKKLINVKTLASGTKYRVPMSHKVFKDSRLKTIEVSGNNQTIEKIMTEYGFTKQQAEDYRMLVELGIHNLNLLIDLFGEPVKIDYADMWSSRKEEPAINSDVFVKSNVSAHRMLVCILEFQGGIKCVWEIGAFFDGEQEYIDKITINDLSEELTIKFPNPFIRGLPLTFETNCIIDNVPSLSVNTMFLEDCFKSELDNLYLTIDTNSIPRTPLEEGKRDINWIKKIIKTIKYE